MSTYCTYFIDYIDCLNPQIFDGVEDFLVMRIHYMHSNEFLVGG